jgi:hypothetical protein
MRADNTAHLAAATRRRAEAARQRARQALKTLDAADTPITYTAVAQTAGVSRTLLYRDPDLRDELLATLREEVKALRTQNRALRLQLATALGEQRVTTAHPFRQ